MKLRAQLFSFCLMIDIGREECSNLWKMIIFLVFLAVLSFSPRFWVGYWVAYIKSEWNNKSATCSFVPDYFYFVWKSRLTGRSAQTYGKWSSRSLVPKIFGQVKKYLMLELHKIITFSKMMSFSVFSQLGPFFQDFGQV